MKDPRRYYREPISCHITGLIMLPLHLQIELEIVLGNSMPHLGTLSVPYICQGLHIYQYSLLLSPTKTKTATHGCSCVLLFCSLLCLCHVPHSDLSLVSFHFLLTCTLPPYFPTHSLILLSLHYFIFLHFSTFFPVLCDGDFRETSMIYIFLPLFIFFLNYPRITTYKCQRA